MTGFGRASVRSGDLRFEFEARSVNHRHLDARVRMPRILSQLEGAIRERIAARIGRGKVDLHVALPEGAELSARVEVDAEAAAQYARAAETLAAFDEVSGTLSVDALISLPGVTRLVEPELSGDELLPDLTAGADAALEALDEMRRNEGAAIERDLETRLARVESMTQSLAGRSDVVRDAARERLRKRTEQLALETGLLDEGRLHQEIAIAIDRLDITEELVRLESHVAQFRAIVASGGPDQPIGRRLDFLLQEFGREANTIGSKGNDAPIAHEVVELKTEIERMREQVQNVE
jgi:uncharacterized protein (TIGR00255 family)